MIYIRVDALTARLRYALHLIFDIILELPYEIVPSSTKLSPEVPHEKCLIDYSTSPLRDSFTVFCSKFLKDKHIHTPSEIDLSTAKTPKDLFPAKKQEADINFDLFASIFFLATDYEKYMVEKWDQHQRYDEAAYHSFIHKWYKKPWVHELAHLLMQALSKRYPSLSLLPLKQSPKLEITFDIDHPWKYKHKSMVIRLGGLMKDVVHRKRRSVRERLMGLQLGIDPNDTFDDIVRHFPAPYVKFFFLVGGKHSNDSRFSINMSAFREIILKLYGQQYAIGIHPSYMSFNDGQLMQNEINALSKVLGSAIHLSRQHYLRYRYPDTFQHLLKAGITDDYSLCMYQDCGFITGMAVPYPWYDVSLDQMTTLTLHPTIGMDTALRAYAGLSVTEALERIHEVMHLTEQVSGVATLLFHNALLSDSDPWEGWRAPFLTFFREQLTLWDPV